MREVGEIDFTVKVTTLSWSELQKTEKKNTGKTRRKKCWYSYSNSVHSGSVNLPKILYNENQAAILIALDSKNNLQQNGAIMCLRCQIVKMK